MRIDFQKQLTNLSSLSSVNGKPLSAVEQVLVRMHQEALVDLSSSVKLSHFIVALAFVPNGPGKFMMSDLLRKGNIEGLALREKLNLPEFIPSDRVDTSTKLSYQVGLVLQDAKIKAEPAIDSFEKIPNTRMLYDSLVYHFSSNGTKENGEHILLQSILNSRILECN